MLNLSKASLTAAEISLLSKGLSFAPQSHFDIFSTLLDVNRFIRNVVLRKTFPSPVDSTQSIQEGVSQETTLLTLNFQDQTAISTLEKLQSESTGGMYGTDKDCVCRGDTFLPSQLPEMQQ